MPILATQFSDLNVTVGEVLIAFTSALSLVATVYSTWFKKNGTLNTDVVILKRDMLIQQNDLKALDSEFTSKVDRIKDTMEELSKSVGILLDRSDKSDQIRSYLEKIEAKL